MKSRAYVNHIIQEMVNKKKIDKATLYRDTANALLSDSNIENIKNNKENALDLCKKAARCGPEQEGVALFNMAKHYYSGTNHYPKHHWMAENLCNEAARKGNAEAALIAQKHFVISTNYYHGVNGYRKDLVSAFILCEHAANAGWQEAKECLSTMKRHAEKAEKETMNNPEKIYERACNYRIGNNGVQADPLLAQILSDKAAKLYLASANTLIRSANDERGKKTQITLQEKEREAIDLCIKAVKAGHTEEGSNAYEMAGNYRFGRNNYPRNVNVSAKLYKNAANAGHPEAKEYLTKTKCDAEKDEKAIIHNPDEICQRAQDYFFGDNGRKKCHASARMLLEKVAEAGNPKAKAMLSAFFLDNNTAATAGGRNAQQMPPTVVAIAAATAAGNAKPHASSNKKDSAYIGISQHIAGAQARRKRLEEFVQEKNNNFRGI